MREGFARNVITVVCLGSQRTFHMLMLPSIICILRRALRVAGDALLLAAPFSSPPRDSRAPSPAAAASLLPPPPPLLAEEFFLRGQVKLLEGFA